jgi:Ulp1 family protease
VYKFDFDNADVFDFPYVEEQPKKETKKTTPKKTTEQPKKETKMTTPKKTTVQAKKETKKTTPKKATNHGRKAKIISVVGNDNKKDSDNLLVFPFILGQQIDKETSSLKMCHFVNSWLDENYNTLSEEEVRKCQQTLSSGHNQRVTITDYDIKTLEPGMFVNDTIIDFWMCWLTRKELPKDSSVYIFTTHFYTKLKCEGYDSVACWAANRGIHVSDKKMILIPINNIKHWSLCAVINAGYIDHGGQCNTCIVLLLLDSLQLHSLTEISENIRTWLNTEYSRIKRKPGSAVFNPLTIRSVNLQGN